MIRVAGASFVGGNMACAWQGDLDGDGDVDNDDLDIVLFEFGNCGQG